MKTRLIFTVLILLTATAALFAQDITATPPALAGSSRDSVLLRYQFTKGQIVTTNANTLMKMNMEMNGQAMPMDMTMNLDMKYTIISVNADKSAQIEFVITRMRVDMAGPMTMDFDSDRKEDAENPQFKTMFLIVNNPFSMVIDSRGKLISFDMKGMMEKMAAADADATNEELERMLNEFTKNSFIQLPEAAVKTGDTYDAGTIEQDISGMGKMTVSVTYKIHAVSGDKRFVILIPTAKMDMPGLEKDGSGMTGWLLFDATRGNITKSYGNLAMKLAVGDAEQKIKVGAEYIIKCSSQF
ncbi:MAG: hypothetical protein EHM28_14095 [Spirochaetaceae bacterium]|nr:MAG: hypothetical protein EHM28_14095 [Spirochaetaceae bacterium]